MKPALATLTLYLFCVTGLKAQSPDSFALPRHREILNKGIYVPAALIAAGFLTNNNNTGAIKRQIAAERNEHLPYFKTTVDNYLQYSPIAIAYGLDAAGIRSKTDIANRTVILLKGELMMLGAVTLLKNTTHELRPDGSAYNSFPSGHTAQAFAAATFLSEEYKGRFKWMPYAAYGMASGVGLLRMANNRHYISDVLLGAGLGILSMKVAYWTHQYKWGKRREGRMGFDPKQP